MDRNKAIEVLKDFWSVYEIGTEIREAFETLIPELKESEDERIRKELIKETKGSEIRLFETVTNDEFVAWLEKQGSQNLANSAKTCKVEQNPAWSEEDEEHLDSIIESYKYLLRDYKDCHDVDYIPYESNTVVRTVIDDVSFLKSLKDKCTWKPSDEQMEALGKICEWISLPTAELLDEIRSLYNDLKKLKE